jgi:D-proline reductase (dithiol) PrdB
MSTSASGGGEAPRASSLLDRIVAMLRAEVDPHYTFASLGPIPWTVPAAPLARMRVALISTAGLHLASDAPFRAATERLGDPSFRLVPQGTAPEQLERSAVYVDQKFVARDPEVALPMETLAQLAREGFIASAAARHATFCGGIVRPLPGLAESAAQLAPLLQADGVTAAVLLPTCSLCVQTVCVLARELEARGLPTVAISLIPELSAILGAPRTLAVHFPFGAPCGDPGNRSLQESVLREALGLLEQPLEPGAIVASRLAWRRSGEPRSRE